MLSSILPASATSGVLEQAAASRLPEQTLGQDDFLKLLVAQMTSQDPLAPTDDAQFFSQMAQFSSLQESRAMQSDLSRLRNDQQLLQANALLGRTVEIQADPTHQVAGVVETVHLEDGTPKILVGGQSYDLSQLLSIAPTAPNVT